MPKKSFPPVPADEALRLEVLKEYGILDTPPDPDYDALISLASLILGTPIALVSLVDQNRQWFKASCGLDANVTETPRDIAFCAYAILGDEVLVVNDATQDDRFRENPLVTGEMGFRFYAGAPLISPRGDRLGTLCVIDRTSRYPTPAQIDALKKLAHQVVLLMEYRKINRELRTEQKRFETQSALKRQIVDFSPDAILTFEVSGSIVEFNPSSERIFGRSKDQVQGMQFVDQLFPEIKRFQEAALLNRRGESRGLRSSGEAFPIEFTLIPVFLDGTPHFTAFIRDLSEPHRLARELRAKTEFLAQVMDHLPVSLFCKDGNQDFKFTLWNRKAVETWGIPESEILGKSAPDFFPTDQAERMQAQDLDTLNGGRTVDIPEEIVNSKSLGRRIVHTVKVPIADESGKPRFILGIAEDITERKQSELQLLNSAKMSSLGQMAAGMAHEINNPLAIIKGQAQLLEVRAESGQVTVEDLRISAGKIAQTVDRIAKIIQGLRSFSRDSKGDPFSPTPLASLLDGALDLCQTRFKNHGVELRRPATLPDCVLDCRASEIIQVLLNLLNNGFDAALSRDQEVKWVSLGFEDLGETVTILVMDSGPGIAPEVQGRLMTPFFTTKGVGKGTGLGLSISKGLAESHGGRLELMGGATHTCFRLALPKKQRSSIPTRRKNAA